MGHRSIRATGDALRECVARFDHRYIRVFALLLLTVLALVAVSALSWCEGCACSCETNTVRTNPSGIRYRSSIRSTGYHYPGEEVCQILECTGMGPVTHVTVIYTPPPGVTNVTFRDPQPTKQRPDGSYVWENLPVHQPPGSGFWDVELFSSHTAPPVPAGMASVSQTSTLTVETGEYESTASADYDVRQGPHMAAEQPAPLPPADLPAQVQPQVEDYYLWHVGTWAWTDGVDLTTGVCQEWVDLLEGEDVFLAARFPLLDATPPYTESYLLPVAFSGQYSPTVSLLDERHYPFTTLLMTALEYKPRYHTALNNALPRADNERWFALGLPADSSLTCPNGLNIPAGEWEIKTNAWLDFGGEQTDCANCILSVYYCYEGQDEPTIPVAALGALGMATTYQGWGITCIGPHLLWLVDEVTASPAFHIHFAGTTTVLPSQRVTFTHFVVNLGSSSVSVTLGVTSTLGGAWQLVGENDPPTPIGQPIHLPANGSQFEFRVVGTVPAGAEGAHTIYITGTNAANAAQKTQTTDLLWVGEWEPPPPFKVYLPVVMAR